ncbi:MAG: hypothetical protein GY719_31030 [bacterium]|nr:hypothetical protein [bacterium]
MGGTVRCWKLILPAVALQLAAAIPAVALGHGSAATKRSPIGDQFQVNSYTTAHQFRPAVAVDSDGDFVVVWDGAGSWGTDSSVFSIHGQRYVSDGSPLGAEFQVNSYTTDAQWFPAVAVDADGDFVVVWSSRGSAGTDTEEYSIQGQRYAFDGSPLGAEFQVNSYTTGSQTIPAVATDADGNFVVVWENLIAGGTGSATSSIQGQRYAADGSPLGAEFQVNTYTTDYRWSSTVAVDADANFVVVWNSQGSSGTDTSGISIQAQRFGADGSPLDVEFQVNFYTTSNQWDPQVAAEANGDFVVVWSSLGSGGTDSSGYSVQGQRYASDGFPVGGQFQVNSYTTSEQWYPAVAVDADGDFVVVWERRGLGGPDPDSIQGQRYASDGSTVGGQFQINSYIMSGPDNPAVANDADGNFAVVWESYGSEGTDSSGWSIQGRLFAGPSIFADGFESGDLSAWW